MLIMDKRKSKDMKAFDNLELWWVTGAQLLYGGDAVVAVDTIHIEDLSGFGKDQDGNADEKKEFVLRNWSYYELQNMITYKAAKYGIKVEKIRPAYTSKTCSWCGHQGFREGITFICENPECDHYGKKEHADYNAARNIANSKDVIKNEE